MNLLPLKPPSIPYELRCEEEAWKTRWPFQVLVVVEVTWAASKTLPSRQSPWRTRMAERDRDRSRWLVSLRNRWGDAEERKTDYLTVRWTTRTADDTARHENQALWCYRMEVYSAQGLSLSSWSLTSSLNRPWGPLSNRWKTTDPRVVTSFKSVFFKLAQLILLGWCFQIQLDDIKKGLKVVRKRF